VEKRPVSGEKSIRKMGRNLVKLELSREARKFGAQASGLTGYFQTVSNHRTLRNEVGFWHCPRQAKSTDGVARGFLCLK